MSVLLSLVKAMSDLPGAIGVAVVDIETGQTLAKAGHISAENIETAGVANARFLRFKMNQLSEQPDQQVEDFLMTLTSEYHVIRLLRRPDGRPSLFLYLVLERHHANLALSRLKLAALEEEINQVEDDYRLMNIECDYVLNASDIRSKIERALHHSENYPMIEENEIPSFMCTELALKLLGVEIGK